MTNYLAQLNTMQRPSLLICAARYGLADYNRNQHLKRILKQQELPDPARAIPELIERESDLDMLRRGGDASYSAVRHLETLIALIAETDLASKAMQVCQTQKACG